MIRICVADHPNYNTAAILGDVSTIGGAVQIGYRTRTLSTCCALEDTWQYTVSNKGLFSINAVLNEVFDND